MKCETYPDDDCQVWGLYVGNKESDAWYFIACICKHKNGPHLPKVVVEKIHHLASTSGLGIANLAEVIKDEFM